MKYLLLVSIFIAVCTFPVWANSLGVTYGSALDDVNVGVHGDYETQVNDVLKVGAEGQFQYGEALTGNLDVAATLGNESLGVRFETINNFKGSALNDIGRTNSIGASIVFPFLGLEWSGGFFGQTGNPFKTIYRLANPTDPTSVEEADQGILIKEESVLNLALKTEFDWRFLELSLRGLFEVFGEGDKYHQIELGFEMGGKLTEELDWVVQGKVIGQSVIPQNDALETGIALYAERSILAGVTYRF